MDSIADQPAVQIVQAVLQRAENIDFPVVLNSAVRVLQVDVSHRGGERHGAAAGDVSLENVAERNPSESLPVRNGSEKVVVDPAPLWGNLIIVSVFVHKLKAGVEHPDFRVRQKEFLDELRLVRVPDVILVAQKNQISGRAGESASEISDIAEVLFISEEVPVFRLVALQKRVDDPVGPVRGTVVHEDDFVGRAFLVQNREKLFGDIGRTVVRRKSY